jgi:hypothetical protein
MDLERFRTDGNWREAFEFGREPEVVLGGHCSADPVLIDDVALILHAQEGTPDEESWLAVVRLRDGRCAFVDAWCDMTGWDCQAGGHVTVASEFETLRRFGIGERERIRLGIPLPEDAADEQARVPTRGGAQAAGGKRLAEEPGAA